MKDSDALIVFFIAVSLAFAYLYFSTKQLIKKAKAENSKLQNQITDLQNQGAMRAQQLYDQWRDNELGRVQSEQQILAQREATTLLQEWKIDNEISIRQDAIQRSQAVIVGKVTEHLAPYMSGFPFNPKEVRFIGTPVDLIVFDGLDEGTLKQIIFIEVKTGSSALTQRQRQIRDAILTGRVIWRELKIK